jgi:mannose/fructose/N-acetylgalactosamine-specific phosphotransferase system component IIC
MEANIIQAILIGFLYYLTVANSPWLTGLTSVSIRQPIVAGTIVGIILGEPTQGLIIGATINVAFIGFISPGGAVASEPGIAGILGTALAIMSGASPSVAVSLAVPFGLLGTLLWNIRMTTNSTFVHILDKQAEEGNIKKMLFTQFVPAQIYNLLLTGVPVFLVVYLGGPAVSGFLETLTGTPLDVLKAIGGVLPALGIVLTLRMLSNRKGILLFFVFGYYLFIYAKIPMLVLAIFGFVFSYVYTELLFKNSEVEGGQ